MLISVSELYAYFRLIFYRQPEKWVFRYVLGTFLFLDLPSFSKGVIARLLSDPGTFGFEARNQKLVRWNNESGSYILLIDIGTPVHTHPYIQ